MSFVVRRVLIVIDEFQSIPGADYAFMLSELAKYGAQLCMGTQSLRLLAHCTTIWLKAEPEDHMKRVTAQGDLRPMAASKEAMDDLKGILAGRAAFYSKAEFQLDTSAQPLPETFEALRLLARQTLRLQT